MSRTDTVANIAPGTRIRIDLSRFKNGTIVPWIIVGTISDSMVNSSAMEMARGAMLGVRLIDAMCDDPMHDCDTHMIATTSMVTVID